MEVRRRRKDRKITPSNWEKLVILIQNFNQIWNAQRNTLALSYPGADLQNNSFHRIARFSF